MQWERQVNQVNKEDTDTNERLEQYSNLLILTVNVQELALQQIVMQTKRQSHLIKAQCVCAHLTDILVTPGHGIQRFDMPFILIFCSTCMFITIALESLEK